MRWLRRPSFHRQRLIVASSALAIALLAAAALIAVEYGLFSIPRPAPQLVIADHVSMYIWKDAAFDDVRDVFDVWWPRALRVRQNGRDPQPPSEHYDTISLQGVYMLTHEAGPTWARTLIGSEDFAVKPVTSPLPHDHGNRAPTPEELAKLRDRALGVLVADLKAAGIKPGIKPNAAGRTWVNWNVALTLAAWPALLIALPIALMIFTIDLLVGSRRKCVASGLCPSCHYNIRGCKARNCPECNEPFTDYERTIIESMLPTYVPEPRPSES